MMMITKMAPYLLCHVEAVAHASPATRGLVQGGQGLAGAAGAQVLENSQARVLGLLHEQVVDDLSHEWVHMLPQVSLGRVHAAAAHFAVIPALPAQLPHAPHAHRACAPAALGR